MKRPLLVVLALSVLLPSGRADEGARGAADSSNAYAFEAFQLFRQITEGNFCYSPYSSQRIAALIAEGARGATAEEMRKLAHLPSDEAERQSTTKSLSAALAASAGKGGLQLEVANSLWAPPAFPFRAEFITLAGEQFGATAHALPGDDPVRSAQAVNDWIRQRTRGRITNLAGPAIFTPRTLALVNTVYLKGTWVHPFDRAKTKPRAFTLNTGSTAMLPTMLQLEALNYADSDSWQCLELQMSAGEVKMIVLLPRDEPSRTKIETQLTVATWQAVTGALEDCDVNVMLPRFSFSTQLSMTSMWQFLGARTLFESGKADLSGMIANEGSFVKEVVHQATIEVNELGAEATAATLVAAAPFGPALAPKPRRKVSFIANRPFLWMIVHRDSGLILFLGRFAGH